MDRIEDDQISRTVTSETSRTPNMEQVLEDERQRLASQFGMEQNLLHACQEDQMYENYNQYKRNRTSRSFAYEPTTNRSKNNYDKTMDTEDDDPFVEPKTI